MSDRWVMDEDYPGGHLVPMTRAEEAQRDTDQAAGAKAAKIEATRRANQDATREALAARMDALRKARSALSKGKLFASLSAGEREVLDALLLGDLHFGRLTLGLFDATED